MCICGKMLWFNFYLASRTECMASWEKKPVRTAKHKNSGGKVLGGNC